MPIINSGTVAQQIYDVSKEVREGFSLDWDNSKTYSSDNMNSMIGQLTVNLRKYEVTR